MKSFLCFAFFVGSAFTNPILRDDASDQYIDSVLENARELILANGLDPADLPGGSVSFHQTIGFIEFKGKAELKDGRFEGLSGIVRNGDTAFVFDPVNNKLSLSANVGMGKGKAHYKASASIAGVGVSASADATVDHVNLFFEAEMCLTEGCSLQLTKFDVKDIGNIDVSFHGLGPLDWILDLVVNLAANLISDFLADIFESDIQSIIQGVLDNLVPDIPSIMK